MRGVPEAARSDLPGSESDPLGSGWNIIQSKTAIGSGGLYGKGVATRHSVPLGFFCRKATTDFIIAVHAEEFGFVGVCLLLLLFLIVARGLVIAVLCAGLLWPDPGR